jgi:hypothetical protein
VDPDPEPELEVMDPDPALELDLYLTVLTKIHKKMSNLIIMTSKKHYFYIFIEKNVLKCHAKTFKIVGIVKE